MNTPTFLDLIDRLTQSTGTYVVTTHVPATKKKPATVIRDTRHIPGLLEQLRTAVFAGMEGTGGSASFGSRPPLDTGAADLLDEIGAQAAEALASVNHMPTPFGHVEQYVRAWAGQTTEHKRLTITGRATVPDADEHAGQRPPYRPTVITIHTEFTAHQLAQKWCDRIEDFFNPPSAREIPFPCPNCGERYVHRVKDGQHIRSCALNFIRDRHTENIIEARCSACAATWAPDMFERLAVLLGGKTYEQVQAEWAEKDAAEAAKAAKRQKSAA
jgi:hypothetical protein